MTAAGARILIVEDSRMQARRLKDLLEGHGYGTAVAENGQIALELLPRFAPHLVISDIVMPVMDGYELCRRIKTDKRFTSTPVLLLTSLSDPKDVLKGLECRADNFVVKPYEEKQLLTRIETIFENEKLLAGGPRDGATEIYFQGERFRISADRRQTLNLLLSTYETAVQKQNELVRAHDKLRDFNERLERRVVERTAELQQEIAERKKAEAALSQVAVELRRVDQMKSEFISVASHELRTPLTSINNAVDLMLKKRAGAITAAQENFLTMAQRNISRLSRMIDDILNVAKIESGNMELEYGAADIGAIIGSVINTMKPLADAKAITLGAEVQEGLPPVPMDSGRIEQVLLNLAGNAVKFTPERGRVTVQARLLERAGPPPQDATVFLEVTVRDTGIGIAAQDLEHIFEKFYQVEDSLTDRERRGTGLGLAISRGIVEKHDGELTCESAVGAGSAFRFTLPLVDRERWFLREVGNELAATLKLHEKTALLFFRIPDFSRPGKSPGARERRWRMSYMHDKIAATRVRNSDRIIASPSTGEIAVIMPGTDLSGGAIVRGKIEQALAGPGSAAAGQPGGELRFESGLAGYPDQETSAGDLIARARRCQD